jgi:hypothetical protein
MLPVQHWFRVLVSTLGGGAKPELETSTDLRFRGWVSPEGRETSKKHVFAGLAAAAQTLYLSEVGARFTGFGGFHRFSGPLDFAFKISVKICWDGIQNGWKAKNASIFEIHSTSPSVATRRRTN